MLAAKRWFDQLWGLAAPLAKVDAQYRRQHASSSNLQRPPPTEDDTVSSTRVGRPHSFSASDLVQLRACRHLWVQAGNLHKNRGPALPGNQLMLRAMSRVYFGYPAVDLPRDTFVGNVGIVFGGVIHSDRTLRFSNNSMDVLALPVPVGGGPIAYDNETLKFERVARRGRLLFELSIAASNIDRARWKRSSDAVGGTFSMTSGRQFGVY